MIDVFAALWLMKLFSVGSAQNRDIAVHLPRLAGAHRPSPECVWPRATSPRSSRWPSRYSGQKGGSSCCMNTVRCLEHRPGQIEI